MKGTQLTMQIMELWLLCSACLQMSVTCSICMKFHVCSLSHYHPYAISNKRLFAKKLKMMNLSDFINSKAKYVR